MNKMNLVKRASLGIAVAALTALPLDATAATSITIDSVTQRWPWNNKVDITYTVDGGQGAGNFQKIVFTTVINGVTHTIDDARASGATRAPSGADGSSRR